MQCLKFGGAKEDRTPDLLIANQSLSQLSYSPTTDDRKKKPTGLAGGSSQAGVTLMVPANALRAYDGLTGRRLLATRKRVKIHC